MIREFFPVARDHYLFGLVAQITRAASGHHQSGALILELGVRTRFLIMGRVAILPRKDLDLVRLQMNILGRRRPEARVPRRSAVRPAWSTDSSSPAKCACA